MRIQTKQKCVFSLEAEQAQEVQLLGEFTRWEEHPIPLRRESGGPWKASVLLEPGEHQYRFRVDGRWCDDPACVTRIPNGFGSLNCVCRVESPAKAAKLKVRPAARAPVKRRDVPGAAARG